MNINKTYKFKLTNENPILKDHVINGDMILPGLSYPDLYYSFIRRFKLVPNEWKICNFAIHQPLILKDSYIQLLATFERVDENSINASIHTNEVTFSRCRITRSSNKSVSAGLSINELTNMKVNCDNFYHIDKCYEICRGLGLFHKDSMRLSAQIFVTGSQLLVDFRGENQQEKIITNSIIPPNVIDAAAISCFHELGIKDGDNADLFLPLAVENIEVYKLLPSHCYAIIDLSSCNDNEELKIIQSMSFYDNEGNLCCHIKRFTGKRVRNQGSVDSRKMPNSSITVDMSSIEESYKSTPVMLLKSWVGKLLHQAPDDVPTSTSFFDLGLSSENLISIVFMLESAYETTFSPTLLFECKNIDNLVKHLEGFKMRNTGETATSTDQTDSHTDSKVDNNSTSYGDKLEIAVIGIDCSFPKSPDLESFKNNLEAGRDCIETIPYDRWDVNNHENIYCKHGGFISDVKSFDAQLFNISPKEAVSLEPNERLFLQCAFKAFENSGYNPFNLNEKNVGVFVGAMNNYYSFVNQDCNKKATLNYLSTISNRVSYTFDLTGPSYTYDTACSSSLVAVHEAISSIKNGECKLALAGGVNLSLHPNKYSGLCELKMLSPTGSCKSFGNDADGYVPGEGVAAVLLKPLSDALNDGDYIYATISGSAVNHGGHAAGFTVPNPIAQSSLITEALNNASIEPIDIDFWEAHGTGTSLGDPIEVAGLSKVFADEKNTHNKLPVSSVKSNIGHLEAAAGISGLIKVILQLKNKHLYSSIHADKLNTVISFDTLPVFIQRSRSDLTKRVNKEDNKFYAGVSSFGAGGTNCCIILSNPPSLSNQFDTDNKTLLFVYSERNIDALSSYINEHIKYLRKPENQGSSFIIRYANTLNHGRPLHEISLVVAAKSTWELKQKLDNVINAGVLLNNDKVIEYSISQVSGFHNEIISRYNLTQNSDIREITSAAKETRLYPNKDVHKLPIPNNTLITKEYWPTAKEKSFNYGEFIHTLELAKAEWIYKGNSASEHPFTIISHSSITNSDYAVHKPQYNINGRLITDELVNSIGKYKACIIDCSIFSAKGALNDDTLHDVFSLFNDITKLASKEQKSLFLHIVNFDKNNNSDYITYIKSLSNTLNLSYPQIDIAYIEGECTLDEYLAKLKSGYRLPNTFTRRLTISSAGDLYYETFQKHKELTGHHAVHGDVSGKNILIIGGLGTLGQSVSKYFSQKGANIICIGRSELTGSRLQLFNEVKSHNTNCQYVKLDLSNQTTLDNDILNLERLGVRIHGVIHAAGAQGNNQFHKKDAAEFFNTIAPKSHGLKKLNDYLHSHPLKFSIYFSSISSFFGDFGHGDYSLSNELLNKQAYLNAESRDDGPVVLSINWPHWDAEGISLSDNEIKQYKSMGFFSLDIDSAVSIFDKIFTHRDQYHNHVLYILSGSTDKILKIANQVSSPNYLESKTTQLPSSNGKLNYSETCTIIKEGIVATLEYELDEIRNDIKFDDYGFDSITYTEMSEYLTSKLGRDVSANLFFEYPSIESIANYLCDSDVGSSTDSNQYLDSDASNESQDHDIAITGLSFRLPGATSLDQAYDLFSGRIDTLAPLEEKANRILLSQNPDKSVLAHFIDDAEYFDAAFFSISPSEALFIDPQQRLLLECTHNAIEDAGYTKNILKGLNVGVYVASQFQEYQEGLDINEHPSIATGNSRSMLANRLSYYFDLKGPSEVYDTACTGSFTAIYRAVQDLRSDRIDCAVVGGINLILSDSSLHAGREMGVISAKNQCTPFQEGADGFTKGEGVIVVTLRRLSDAIKNNDHIYAVINGIEQLHGGTNSTLVAPNKAAQVRSIQNAIADAKLTPSDIDYVEAQGSGGEIGDPIEFNALNDALGSHSKNRYISSIKPSIGHLEAASGLSSLVKVITSFNYNVLFPILNFGKLNNAVKINNRSLQLLTSNFQLSNENNGKQVALIHNYGFGGVNVDMVVSNFVSANQGSYCANSLMALPLSAANDESLISYIESLINHLSSNKDIFTSNYPKQLAYTFQVRKTHYANRVVVIYSNLDNLIDSLSDSLAYFKNNNSSNNPGKIFKSIQSASSAADLSYLENKAQLWLDGNIVDWPREYTNTPQPVHVPEYKFVKTRYWASNYSISKRKNDSLSAIIKNVSTINTAACSVEVTNNDIFITQHKIFGLYVVPGVFQLDFITFSFKLLVSDASRIEFKNITWSSPIVVADAQNIYCIIKSKGNDYQVTLTSTLGDNAIEYCSATIILHDHNNIDESKPVVTGNCRCLPTVDFYGSLSNIGFEYGPDYRLSSNIEIYDDTLTADICGKKLLPDSLFGPNVLDAALHSCFALVSDKISPNKTFMPFSIESLTAISSLPSVFSLVASLVHYSDKETCFDLYILSKEERIIGVIKSLRIKESSINIDNIAIENITTDNSDDDISTYIKQFIAEVIGTENPNLSHSFSYLGMDSIYLTRLGQLIRSKFDINVSTKQIFNSESPAELIELLTNNTTDTSTSLDEDTTSITQEDLDRYLDFLE